MLKKQIKIAVLIFGIIVISILFTNTNFARSFNFENNEISDWKVKISNDTKDLIETKDVKFIIEENKNVVNGKFAPGCKAKAVIEIDLTGTKMKAVY